MSSLLSDSVKKAWIELSCFRMSMWRSLGMSVLMHVSVFLLATELDRPNFLASKVHDENPIHFIIDVKVTNGDSLSRQPPESSSDSRQLTELAEAAQTAEQQISNKADTTNSFKQPTQTTRPIGHYTTSSWGRFHFVNMTEVLFNKTSQFIGQLSPLLAQINFSGRCVMYVGPSDLMVSLQCSAKEEQVSQLLPLIQQHFRLEPDLAEYWRCIDITATQISLKEKCDAL